MAILSYIFIVWSGVCRIQAQPTFDPDSAVQIDYIPTNGTFYSIQGDWAPLPFDPFPLLSLYYDGTYGVYWFDDTSYSHGGGFSPDDAPFPGSGGDTNGYDIGPVGTYNIQTFTLTTNYSQYTNFWLTIACSPTNSLVGDVTIVSTLPGLYYAILTNADLNKTGTNWVVWTNLLATSSNTPAPPTTLSQTNLNFRGQIILPSGSYITNGLVAYWKMNDASGPNAADSSGYGKPLVLTNSPGWGPGCLILNVNGSTNQYGDAGTNPAEIVYQDMTVCAWINQTSNAYKGIVDKSFNYPQANQYGGWGFWIQNDGHLLFHAGDTDINDGPGIVPPGQWCFVSVVWHLSTQKADFYINGVYNGESGLGTVVNYGTYGLADVQVGNLQNNLSNGLYAFNGSIRDVGIYNRALSSAEIQSNYQSTAYITNVTIPDLLYYKMLDYNSSNATAPGFPLYDSSSHGGTTGTYSNASETWVTNQASLPHTALHFSGSVGYIDTTNSSLFNFTTNSFTINLWLAPDSADGYVMGNNTYDSNGWFLSVNNSYQIYFGSETSGSETVLNVAKPYGWPSNYNMVTVTRTGTSNPQVYINGVPVSAGGSFTSPAPSTNSLKFGTGTNQFGSQVLDGNISQPQIWSRDLSPSEVLILYTNQLTGVPWP